MRPRRRILAGNADLPDALRLGLGACLARAFHRGHHRSVSRHATACIRPSTFFTCSEAKGYTGYLSYEPRNPGRSGTNPAQVAADIADVLVDLTEAQRLHVTDTIRREPPIPSEVWPDPAVVGTYSNAMEGWPEPPFHGFRHTSASCRVLDYPPP